MTTFTPSSVTPTLTSLVPRAKSNAKASVTALEVLPASSTFVEAATPFTVQTTMRPLPSRSCTVAPTMPALVEAHSSTWPAEQTMVGRVWAETLPAIRTAARLSNRVNGVFISWFSGLLRLIGFHFRLTNRVPRQVRRRFWFSGLTACIRSVFRRFSKSRDMGCSPHRPGASASLRHCYFPPNAGPLYSGTILKTEIGTTPAALTPAHYINRELSWLEFNQRVLDEALDKSNPLLERVKFFCIVSSNLDEFFEVRVAGIKQQMESEMVERSVDGLTATETFRAINRRIRRLVEQQYACWRDQLRPALARSGILFLNIGDLNGAEVAWLEEFYRAEVRPVLTPLAIDPAHPFPQLLNKSLNMIVQVEKPTAGQPLRHLAVVQVPRVLPRLVKVPRDDSRQ